MTIPKKPRKSVKEFIAAADKPEVSSVVTTIRFRSDLLTEIDAAAERACLNRSAWITFTLAKAARESARAAREDN